MTPKKKKAADADLTRDLFGYVWTPAGFLSKPEFLAIVAAHPEIQFPDYESIPLMESSNVS